MCLTGRFAVVDVRARGGTQLETPLSCPCDIAEVVRAYPGLDWSLLRRKAHKAHSDRIVRISLLLARDLLGATVSPSWTREIARDTPARRLADQIEEQLLREHESQYYSPDMSWGNLQAKERLSDRIMTLLWLTVTPTAKHYDTLPLPAALTGLYYVLRPILLVVRFVSRRLKHGKRARS